MRVLWVIVIGSNVQKSQGQHGESDSHISRCLEDNGKLGLAETKHYLKDFWSVDSIMLMMQEAEPVQRLPLIFGNFSEAKV